MNFTNSPLPCKAHRLYAFVAAVPTELPEAKNQLEARCMAWDLPCNHPLMLSPYLIVHPILIEQFTLLS